MFKKLWTFIKTFDQQVLSKEVNLNKGTYRNFNMKGSKVQWESIIEDKAFHDEKHLESIKDHIPRMLPRKIRIKAMGYMLLFGTWYVGVVAFIMYRVKGDDLDELEKEAMEKLEF